MVSRRIGLVSLGIVAALALALGLWAFEDHKAAATPPLKDLTVVVTSNPSSGTWAPGTLVAYEVVVTSDADTAVVGDGINLAIDLAGVTLEGSVTATAGVNCTGTDPILCDSINFSAPGNKTVNFSARTTGAALAQVGAFVDKPGGDPSGDLVEEGNDDLAVDGGEDDGDDGDDEGATACDAVGEGIDGAPTEEPDNFDCVTLSVATADLTITKTANPASGTIVGQDTLIHYTLTVSNIASVATGGTAKDVGIRDTFSPGLALFGSVDPGVGVICGDVTPPINCTAAQIAPGTSVQVELDAQVTVASGTVLNGAAVDPQLIIGEVNDDADDPDTGHDCATVGEGSDAGEATEEDNFDCTVNPVGAALDLTITKTASPATGTSVATGSTITYTLTASATQAATGVVIRDRPGTGLTFVSMAPASGSAGTGVTCTDTTGPEYDCTAASIPAGESRSVTVVATVAATSGTVLNGATVDPANSITESNEDADDPTYDCAAVGEGSDSGNATEEDNFECTSHTIGGLDLRVTKTASPADGSSVASGGTITYTVTVTAANAAASNVAIRDTVGSGLSVATVTAGSGVTCSDTTGPEINCTAASIASGASVTVTLTATVSATSGTVINGARVDPAGTITESNEDADDPGLDCTAVGEGSDTGDATEPDNFDCTSHTVGGAAGTRTLTLSPAGWHNFVWTGASGTALETAFACISGKFSIAYEWVDSLQVFERYVPGQASLTNMDPLTQYDHAFVLITAENVTCVMPVVTP